jgi:hypothetical protein
MSTLRALLVLLLLPAAVAAQTSTDTDGDGVLNNVDNCRRVANPLQENQDADRQGDACDNCPGVTNDNQFNTDGDALGDACDPDDDNDLIDDGADSCPRIVNSGRDADLSGVDDVCERPFGMFQVDEADVITNHNQPTVASASNGDFVVAWMGYKTGPHGNYGIWARRMNADGSPKAIDFEVSTDLTPPVMTNPGELQMRPAVASRPDGEFVVVWQSPGTPGRADPVVGQLFASDGTRVGPQVMANDGATHWTADGGAWPPVGPEVGFAPDGRFTLVWGDSLQRGIMAHRYTAGATSESGPFVLKAGAGSEQRPRAAWGPDGDFLLVWDGQGADLTRDVFAQRFDATGAATGPEVVIASAPGREEQAAAAAATGEGSFVVVWRSMDNATESAQAVGRRITAIEAPEADTVAGPTFEVGAIGGYSYPGVDGADDGSFVVVWRGASTFARPYAADATPRGPAQVVPQFSGGDVYTHGVATQPNGGFVVSWQNHMPGYHAMARLFSNTVLGAGVVSQPMDAATGTSPVSLTFDTVTWPGTSTLEISSAGSPPPSGFATGDPATWYDIATTADFSGNVGVCIRYTGITYADEAALRLFHFEGGAWVDRTTSLDVATDTVCGSVASLSPFAVFQAGNRPPVADAGPDLQVECAGAQGATVTLDGSGSVDPDGDVLAATWSGGFGTAPGLVASVVLPLGTSTVSLQVDDGSATATDTAVVRVLVTPDGLQAPLGDLVPEGAATSSPDMAFRQGRTLPLKLRLRCGSQPLTAVAAPRIEALQRSGAALDLATLDLDAGEAHDGGTTFRPTDDGWIYNLSTSGLASGTYLLRIRMPDQRSWDAEFVLR